MQTENQNQWRWWEAGESPTDRAYSPEPPLVFNRVLTDAEREAVYSYYAEKHGLTLRKNEHLKPLRHC